MGLWRGRSVIAEWEGRELSHCCVEQWKGVSTVSTGRGRGVIWAWEGASAAWEGRRRSVSTASKRVGGASLQHGRGISSVIAERVGHQWRH